VKVGREEGRGKREEGRGKREEGMGNGRIEVAPVGVEPTRPVKVCGF
jgi:hypothetical protein